MTRDVLRYTGGDLDRADALRKKPEWVTEQLVRPDALVVAMWRDQHLLGAGGDPLLRDATHLLDTASERVLLGLREGAPVFAVDLSSLEQHQLDLPLASMRDIAASLAARDSAVLGYARGMLHWHRQHHFCGYCGHATESRNGGHVRVCLREACVREWYPAMSPAVIMLVERPASADAPRRCLLARHGRLPQGVWSTLAGFVEPGESLEETVTREVFEESGVHVTAATYQASQPWPFPASLMLAFRAVAASDEITIDADELDEARWFTADEVRQFADWHDTDAEYRLPRRDSVARMLIDEWVGEGESLSS